MKEKQNSRSGTRRAPLLIVVSAPSGAGKSTLCRLLLNREPNIVYSVSCTTRPPRSGERDGVHYHFLSGAEFARRLKDGEFLENAQVHGYQYGTLKKNVYDALASGRDVLMDIDVQGAAQIRATCAALSADDPIRNGFTDIFIAPPSMDELRRRLCGRATDTDETITRRLRNAAEEMKQQTQYHYTVVNDDLQKASDELIIIIRRERENRA